MKWTAKWPCWPQKWLSFPIRVRIENLNIEWAKTDVFLQKAILTHILPTDAKKGWFAGCFQGILRCKSTPSCWNSWKPQALSNFHLAWTRDLFNKLRVSLCWDNFLIFTSALLLLEQKRCRDACSRRYVLFPIPAGNHLSYCCCSPLMLNVIYAVSAHVEWLICTTPWLLWRLIADSRKQ